MKYSALEGWSFYKMKNYPEKALINIICADNDTNIVYKLVFSSYFSLLHVLQIQIKKHL